MQSARQPRNLGTPTPDDPKSSVTAPTSTPHRTAMARLAWALGRTLQLCARLYGATGRAAPDLRRLELALGQASLPDEYVDIARQIAAIELPAAGSTGGATVLSSLRQALTVVAKAVSADAVASEFDALKKAYDDEQSDDPQPLLATVQRLAEAVAITRESSDILGEGLRDVQGGIRRLVEREDATHSQIRATRERIAGAKSTEDLTIARTALLEETATLERVL